MKKKLVLLLIIVSLFAVGFVFNKQDQNKQDKNEKMAVAGISKITPIARAGTAYCPSSGTYTVTDVSGKMAYGQTIGYLTANHGVTSKEFKINSDGTFGGYTYSQTTGWVNMGPAGGGAKVDCDTGILSGFVYSETLGWVKLNATSDPNNRSRIENSLFKGYAYGETAGWVSLSGAGAGGPGDGGWEITVPPTATIRSATGSNNFCKGTQADLNVVIDTSNVDSSWDWSGGTYSPGDWNSRGESFTITVNPVTISSQITLDLKKDGTEYPNAASTTITVTPPGCSADLRNPNGDLGNLRVDSYIDITANPECFTGASQYQFDILKNGQPAIKGTDYVVVSGDTGAMQGSSSIRIQMKTSGTYTVNIQMSDGSSTVSCSGQFVVSEGGNVDWWETRPQ